MITKEDLAFTPTEDKILGVFGDDIHIEIKLDNDEESVVLIVSRDEYQRTWNNWLDGKKSICERYGEYCGVFGNFEIEKCKKEKSITLNVFNPAHDDNDESTWFDIPTKVPTFRVIKFGDRPDFEHG